MKSEQITEIAVALAKAQGQMKNPTFDRTNPHFRSGYTSLPATINTNRKALSDNGLSLSQSTELRDGVEVLVTLLMHISGQWLQSERMVPPGLKPQEYGSWMTYARRYALQAITGVAGDDDDDANAAQKTNGHIASPITREQTLVLTELITEVGGKQAEKLAAAFLKHFAIKTLPELPAAAYDKAVAAIEAKRTA